MHPAANPFDLVTGLPVHPLVVHAAVVLFPLGLLALLAVLLVPRLRRAYGWPALLLLVVGAVFVPIAKESGEQLAHHIGEPRDHARYADLLTAVAFATVVAALLWWLLDRLAARRAAAPAAATPQGVPAGRREAHGAHVATTHRPSLLGRLLGALAGLLALASLVLTVVVGHTGATATWKGEAASWSASAPSATATPAAGATSTATSSAAATVAPVPSASASAAGERTYAMTQVKEHSTVSSCWTAISGSVYDLTTWIAQHPGGEGPIKGLCGTDGTAAFTAQHGGDTGPQERLKSFRIGALKG